jgi:hypothetical protein
MILEAMETALFIVLCAGFSFLYVIFFWIVVNNLFKAVILILSKFTSSNG